MIGLLLLLLGDADQPAPITLLPPPPMVHTPPAPGSPSIVQNPDWERLPSGDQLADIYPDQARDYGVTGRAVIKCRILAAGQLSDCEVISETPAGLGFGRATLQAARYFKMRPKTINGTPVEGGTVIIPLRWQLARELPTPTAADLPAARTCLGWAQARADLERSQLSFHNAALASEAFGQAAGLAGLRPTQMVAERR